MSNDRLIVTSILDQQRKDTAAEMSESRFFEFFCSSQLLKDYDLSYDELASGVIGSGNDGGIDSIYIFLNGELIQEDTELENIARRRKNQIDIHIIQSKKVNGFGEEAINKLISSIEDLFDLSVELKSLSTVYGSELRTIVGQFHDVYKTIISSYPDIHFNFYYATVGDDVHPSVRRKVDRLRQVVIKHFDNATFNFDFVGARELLQIARREPVSNFELEFIENPISTENGSYVCLVPIKSYYNFFVDENDVIIRRIFDANVRDYQGNVKVNKAIQDTLQNPGKEDFWFLNNGVTIVCPKASATGKRLLIEDPQIVNGLQTSFEIYAYFKGLRYDSNDPRKILVRVIVEEDAASRDNIVRATNSQTAIPETSLRAADKIQRDIEDYLYHNEFYYERRKNFYKNAGRPVARIVSISYMSQALISILLQQPDYARARPSTLINKDEDYVRIFNSKYPVQLYLACIKLMKRVEDFLRTRSDNIQLSRKDINNIKFHLAMLATMALTSKGNNIRVEDIQAIDITRISDQFLLDQAVKVLDVYKQLGATDQVAKGSVFVDRLIRDFQSSVSNVV